MELNEVKSELKRRIAKGLNFGIEAFEEVVEDSSDLFNEYILLQSKYNDLMYLSSMNTMPYDQVENGLDRLRANLLSLVNKIEGDNIKNNQINSDLKIKALPTRRTNFFKLLDIHFRNLDDIRFIETSYGHADVVKSSREAIFEYYQMHRRKFRNREDLSGQEGLEILKHYFHDFFSNELGMFEVYFKNIKHMLDYAMESDIEQQFFLDTLSSLISRFEAATIFYFQLSDLDQSLGVLLKKSKLITPEINDILIANDKIDYFLS